MLLFYKLVQETQMSKPPQATWRHNLTKNLFFYLSEKIQKARFNVRHPVLLVVKKVKHCLWQNPKKIATALYGEQLISKS